MNRVEFFDGQKPRMGDLQDLQDYIQTEILRRSKDTFTAGILGNVDNYILGDIGDTIKLVSPIIVVDSNGEFIDVASATGLSPDAASSAYPKELKAQGTGTANWDADTTYQICVVYKETDTTPAVHPVTATFHFTRKEAGYTLYAYRKGVDSLPTNAVILAEVTYVTAISILSIVNSAATYFRLGSERVRITVPVSTATRPVNYSGTMSLQDHINSIGTGTVSSQNPHGVGLRDAGIDTDFLDNHEKRSHSDGILGDITATLSGFFGFVNWVTKTGSTYDTFYIRGLISGEFAVAGGKWGSSTEFSGLHEFRFVDGTNVVPNGAYTIYIDTETGLFGMAGNAGVGYNYIHLIDGDSTTREIQSEGVLTTETVMPLWILTWRQTPAASSVPEVSIPPADGTSNFTAKLDGRFFGTLGGDNLKISAEDDTFNVAHNVTVKSFRNLAMVGEIKMYAGLTDPTWGYICDGRSLLTTEHTELFEVIGYTFGGSGSTFNIPDFRGYFARGYDAGRGIDSGRVFGSTQEDAFEEHTHTTPFQLSGTNVNNGPTMTALGGTTDTGATGDTETRPKNIAINYVICY